jgi:osmotically-inducible protein OsmY
MKKYSLHTALLFISSLVITTLQGCAPVLIAGAATGAVVASKDPRPTSMMISDKGISARATDVLHRHPELDDKIHINVETYNGVVLLTGETLSESSHRLAVDLVKQVNGVKKVYNEIAVADLSSFQARTKDSLITSKIKSKMASTEGFESGRIKVVTERRVVYLMGWVNEEQGHQAAEMARHVEDVQKVVKLFEYPNVL